MNPRQITAAEASEILQQLAEISEQEEAKAKQLKKFYCRLRRQMNHKPEWRNPRNDRFDFKVLRAGIAMNFNQVR